MEYGLKGLQRSSTNMPLELTPPSALFKEDELPGLLNVARQHLAAFVIQRSYRAYRSMKLLQSYCSDPASYPHFMRCVKTLQRAVRSHLQRKIISNSISSIPCHQHTSSPKYLPEDEFMNEYCMMFSESQNKAHSPPPSPEVAPSSFPIEDFMDDYVQENSQLEFGEDSSNPSPNPNPNLCLTDDDPETIDDANLISKEAISDSPNVPPPDDEKLLFDSYIIIDHDDESPHSPPISLSVHDFCPPSEHSSPCTTPPEPVKKTFPTPPLSPENCQFQVHSDVQIEALSPRTPTGSVSGEEALNEENRPREVAEVEDVQNKRRGWFFFRCCCG
ncbi:hypothetical protein P9112_000211 [Eukaryota sp. TZLM1-RC]